MAAGSIVRSISSMFNGFWMRHRRNLGLAVAGALEARRIGVGVIGRHMPVSVCPKHAIKRLDRFLSNPRFDDDEAQATLLRTLIGPRKRVLIAVDWTMMRRWQVLVAGVIQRGRCVPALWAINDLARLHKSQNAFENGFFTRLAACLPEGTEAVVIMDRGFRRVSLVKHLESIGLSYVIRTSGGIEVRHRRYHGPLDEMPIRRNRFMDMHDTELTLKQPTTVRLVSIWKPRQVEPWHLMTNIADRPAVVASIYAKRFHIEETFRDEKDHRFGMSLGYLKCNYAERLTRILLVAALAHLLAMIAGAAARARGLDREYRANTPGSRGRKAHSDFTLGVYYIASIRLNLPRMLDFLWTAQLEENWG